MSSYTPGPWRWMKPDIGDNELVAADGREVLGVSEWLSLNGPDAALIAAAPDLLAALQNLLLTHDSCACDECQVAEQAAEAAIAKAEEGLPDWPWIEPGDKTRHYARVADAMHNLENEQN